MRSLFVSESDEITIKFTVAEDKDGDIFCGINKEEFVKSLEEGCEFRDYEMVFKKPSFGDSVKLYSSIFNINANDGVNFNPVMARYNKIIALIKRWTLTDDSGKPTEEQIMKLHPFIANTVGIQLENLIGDSI